jgi:hypothetical protein
MAQQGTQMKFGAREGFAYRSLKLVLRANGNGFAVVYNILLSIHLSYCSVPTLTFLDTQFHL